MIKSRMTKKEIKATNRFILKVPYCDLFYTLRYKQPYAYTCGADGWHSDIYNIGVGIVISTGYQAFGTRDFDIIESTEKQAKAIAADQKLDFKETEIKTNDLVEKLVNYIEKRYLK